MAASASILDAVAGVWPLAWSRALVEYAIDASIVVVVAGFLLCVARLLRGPHLADRALAVDTIAIHVIALTPNAATIDHITLSRARGDLRVT